MSDIKKLAIEIFEERGEAKNRLNKNKANAEKERKERIEKAIMGILNVFHISNIQEESTILVWKLKLCRSEKEEYLSFMVSFEEGQTNVGYINPHSVLFLEWYKNGELGKNYALLDCITQLKIPSYDFEAIYDYAKEVLSDHFNIAKVDENDIIFELRTKKSAK